MGLQAIGHGKVMRAKSELFLNINVFMLYMFHEQMHAGSAAPASHSALNFLSARNNTVH